MISNPGSPELRPSIAMPVVYKVAAVDPVLCRRFAHESLPLMLAAEGTKMFHVCDRDRVLSDFTQTILDETVEKTGDFNGPAYAEVTGYNLPHRLVGSGNSNGYHSDGCEEVAIISTSGKGSLHVAWIPQSGPEDNYLSHTFEPAEGKNIIHIKDGPKVVGHVRPMAVIDCKPGTLVRINQLAGDSVKDDSGYTWSFMHGLYDARGQRVALQFRALGKDGCITSDSFGYKRRRSSR